MAKRVARELGLTYIDTGAMYRAVAWKVLQSHGDVTEEATKEAAKDIDIRLSYEGEKMKVFVDGTEVTEAIRTPEVSRNVSAVASFGFVREKLVELQRRMADCGSVLMDGRDIGTHVLPKADVKIYLTASVRERAQRRAKELREKGHDVELAEVEQEIAARDKADMEREISPLRQAEDAILVDTTGLSIDEVVAKLMALCKGAA